MHALENKLGEYVAALQFQKTDKKSKTLERYAAIISVQALLLEHLSASKILSKSECTQILEAHSPVSNSIMRREIAKKPAQQLLTPF